MILIRSQVYYLNLSQIINLLPLSNDNNLIRLSIAFCNHLAMCLFLHLLTYIFIINILYYKSIFL